MARYSVRITKFRDRAAFRASVEFLARLYPDRAPRDFEVALAKLPCLLSHDADEEAARALDRALRKRGADLRLGPSEVDATGSHRVNVSSTVELSPEIDLSFLDQARKPRREPDRAAAPASSEGKAPWEQ